MESILRWQRHGLGDERRLIFEFWWMGQRTDGYDGHKMVDLWKSYCGR